MFLALQDPDLEWLFFDSTVVRAHPHAAGANGGNEGQALGRSRGGFSTKIHVSADGLGNPTRSLLSGGSGGGHQPCRAVDRRPAVRCGDRGQGLRQ